FGMSGLVIGRAVGATLGRVIDQRLLGGGSGVIEHGRLERLRLTGAAEGAPVPRVWGRMRLGGQVIWASEFAKLSQHRGAAAARWRAARRYANTAIRYRWPWRFVRGLCWGWGVSGRMGWKLPPLI
ncbi:MAG: hypothetical protein LAT78_09415, partial [Roseinatronobacter sp.]|nr:hypothetical protein [Roseinatronobacter sp.]